MERARVRLPESSPFHSHVLLARFPCRCARTGRMHVVSGVSRAMAKAQTPVMVQADAHTGPVDGAARAQQSANRAALARVLRFPITVTASCYYHDEITKRRVLDLNKQVEFLTAKLATMEEPDEERSKLQARVRTLEEEKRDLDGQLRSAESDTRRVNEEVAQVKALIQAWQLESEEDSRSHANLLCIIIPILMDVLKPEGLWFTLLHLRLSLSQSQTRSSKIQTWRQEGDTTLCLNSEYT
ncbi:hypothetical protein CBR_g23510 [Chara braunii]|uniref:Uncharacterized protein n=1 Tax=Chara braunii TaxID=69332 RepID=A0A388L4E6_CHABU|nr:hypothetical protein CBR_g23510 [Chara braunii]|eukprot:GBG77185.1 hypothetical protein CBR_g23510 [Chara braunii]